MNFNAMDMLSKFMMRGSNATQNAIYNNSEQSINYSQTAQKESKNISYYPETFFTKPQTQKMQFQQKQNHGEQSFGNITPDIIKSLLPLFIGKGENKNGIGNLLQNINPQFSNLLTAFTKKANSSASKASAKNIDPLIDMSYYIDIT